MIASFPQKWGIRVQVATQVTSQKLCLNVRRETDADLLAEEGVLQILSLAFLICH